MMGANRHCVGIASIFITIVSARHDTSFCEPLPRRSDLTTFAALAVTLHVVATSCCISSTQKSLELSIGFNAETIIEGFGSGMGPAGATVGLISHMTNDILAFRPSLSCIESGRKVFGQEVLSFNSFGRNNCPIRIYHCSHH